MFIISGISSLAWISTISILLAWCVGYCIKKEIQMEKFESPGALGQRSRKYTYKEFENAVQGVYKKIKGVFVHIIKVKKQGSRITIHGMLMMHDSLMVKEVQAIVIDGRLESIEENTDVDKALTPSSIIRSDNSLDSVYTK